MRIYNLHKIDSFTNQLFGGNPTAAVVDADTLSDKEMKQIAREMNLSETSFILRSDSADFRLRYFTPTGSEIRFCGHATVGALCTIAKKKLYDCTKPYNQYRVETNAGILNMAIDLAHDTPRYIIEAPPVEFELSHYEGLSIDETLVDKSKTVLLEKTNRVLYIVAKNLESLKKLDLTNSNALEFAKNRNLVLICVFTNETFDSKNQLHARGYAPAVGIPEDPFTGSMQAGIARYAIQYNMVPKDSKMLGVEQGHFMDRPGEVKLEILPDKIRLHAEAKHVYETNITL